MQLLHANIIAMLLFYQFPLLYVIFMLIYLLSGRLKVIFKLTSF